MSLNRRAGRKFGDPTEESGVNREGILTKRRSSETHWSKDRGWGGQEYVFTRNSVESEFDLRGDTTEYITYGFFISHMFTNLLYFLIKWTVIFSVTNEWQTKPLFSQESKVHYLLFGFNLFLFPFRFRGFLFFRGSRFGRFPFPFLVGLRLRGHFFWWVNFASPLLLVWLAM